MFRAVGRITNQPHAVPFVNPSACYLGLQHKDPLRLEGWSSIHPSILGTGVCGF